MKIIEKAEKGGVSLKEIRFRTKRGVKGRCGLCGKAVHKVPDGFGGTGIMDSLSSGREFHKSCFEKATKDRVEAAEISEVRKIEIEEVSRHLEKESMDAKLINVRVDRIRVDYLREVGSFSDVDALVASILDIGLVEPIVIEPDASHEGYFVLIAGYRRLRAYIAAKVFEITRSRPTHEVPKPPSLGIMTIPAVIRERTPDGWADKARRAENLARKGYTAGEERRLASGRTQEPYQSSVVRFRERGLNPPELPDRLANPDRYDPRGPSANKAWDAYADRADAFLSRSDTNPAIWHHGTQAFTWMQDEIRRFQKNEDGGTARGT